MHSPFYFGKNRDNRILLRDNKHYDNISEILILEVQYGAICRLSYPHNL